MTTRDRGRHLAPVLRPTTFAAWWWLTVVGGAAILIGALRGLRADDVVAAGLGAWLLFGFVVVAELRPIIASRRTDPEGMNLATAFLFAVLLRWGPELAMLAVVFGTVVGEVAHRKRVYAGAFNVAQYLVAYGAAWLVLRAGGWDATPSEPASLVPDQLLLIVAAGVAYHMVNLLVVGTGLSLLDGTPWWPTVTEGWRWHTSTTGAVVGLAPLVVVVLEVHEGFLPLLALPLALLWATARFALEREARSHTDALTGLANRDHLADLLAARLEDPEVRRWAFCMLDLDRFKEVNDTLGHGTGDALLRAAADRLRRATDGDGAAARVGGDEFVALIALRDADDPAVSVERLADELDQSYEIAGVRLDVELSVGVAIAPDDGTDLETLLRRADVAMSDAKAAGELLRIFDPRLERDAPRSLELLTDLRRGISAGELELHYQPQVAVPDGTVVGVEALVRWRHPQRGIVLPGEFLPLLERTATMRLLTAAVLELVTAQAAAWRSAGLVVPVSVNTSPHDLADGCFADRVLAHLEEHQLDPTDLVIEITEQALVGDAQAVHRTLDALRAAGVGLSLDDFGTGHASLTRLARLPVGEVKLDRQFVVELELDTPEVVAIVRSAIELAHAIGARTVAEGVETSHQWDLLRDLGCDAVQGWSVAAAMPPAEVTSWLRERVDDPVPSARTVVLDEDPTQIAPSGEAAGER